MPVLTGNRFSKVPDKAVVIRRMPMMSAQIVKDIEIYAK